LTIAHQIFVSPCSYSSPCLIVTSVCPAANKVFIGLYNEGDANAACSTCPWAYLAIK
jgi:hypothetical protein